MTNRSNSASGTADGTVEISKAGDGTQPAPTADEPPEYVPHSIYDQTEDGVLGAVDEAIRGTLYDEMNKKNPA